MNGGLEQWITLILYMLCFEIISTNSRTSTLWKLNSDQTKIIEASPFHQVVSYPEGSNGAQFITEDDPVFNIITSTVHLGQSWVKERVEYYCTSCHTVRNIKTERTLNGTTNVVVKNLGMKLDAEEVLDCGKPVNFTYYDNLVGVLNRNKHPNVPEPQAALIFTKKAKNKNNLQDFDVDALERRLKKAKREKPKSVQLYNQIGNFWRIKGDAEKAIECFRRALAVSPHNAEVLLNLARVLFTLQYLDDAIYLTRRSLEVQPPDKGAWQQYFTLGEILKAYGHYQEASIHLKHTLELRPGFEPAQIALKEMEGLPTASIHIYTLVIIICLVLGVLLVILSSVDNMAENDYSEVKTQRHFNKAMAMRSLRGFGISQKHTRSKKVNA
ncbi:tetratricopeptide repeat protein 17-like [Asbolus verrucosus]|uniref:Tetratricopeptide repeat protein 17-like n=1 Tax=Asbolus verrucosus TaxID=1661398 RepID=A0A482VCE6_ASBVE|nr:tetratricopeptide repeat protein 17-like [Asbolus verrucosus]